MSYHDRCVVNGGPAAWLPRSTLHAKFEFSRFLSGEHLNSFVYAALVGNEEALHYRIVDACQTISNYPGIFAHVQLSMMRRVEACMESHGGHFEHLL
jgi:hypothetical protein